MTRYRDAYPQDAASVAARQRAESDALVAAGLTFDSPTPRGELGRRFMTAGKRVVYRPLDVKSDRLGS